MNKYLVQLKNSHTNEIELLQLEASTSDEVMQYVLTHHSEMEIINVKGTWGGKRLGAGRVSQWGDGVETDRRRLPIKYSRQAEEIISEIDMVNSILEAWEDKVNDSRSKTQSGEPSERYKYVAQMIRDLKQAMQVTSEKLI